LEFGSERRGKAKSRKRIGRTRQALGHWSRNCSSSWMQLPRLFFAFCFCSFLIWLLCLLAIFSPFSSVLAKFCFLFSAFCDCACEWKWQWESVLCACFSQKVAVCLHLNYCIGEKSLSRKGIRLLGGMARWQLNNLRSMCWRGVNFSKCFKK